MNAVAALRICDGRRKLFAKGKTVVELSVTTKSTSKKQRLTEFSCIGVVGIELSFQLLAHGFVSAFPRCALTSTHKSSAPYTQPIKEVLLSRAVRDKSARSGQDIVSMLIPSTSPRD